MRIRTFIMATSAAVAMGFFGVSYVVIGYLLEHTVRENARESSATLAQVTFTGMYQVMNTGWRRAQAEKFIAAIRDSAKDTPTHLQIYRGPVVAADYGNIEQPPLDASLEKTFADGKPLTETPSGGVRYLMPLVAGERCLRCHESAREGDVLGVIEVHQDFGPLVAKARHDFLVWLALSLPLLMGLTAFAVWRVSRRLEKSIETIDRSVERVNAVADLRQLEFPRHATGFKEFDGLFGHLNELIEKLRDVAVDKHVLRFEIGVLEKFVITSDVVRDWGDYIARLLVEVNTVMPTHMLFSLFEIGDEVFDIEVFWSRVPTAATREAMETHVRRQVMSDRRFSGLAQLTLSHHMPPGSSPELDLDPAQVALHTKTLMIDRPRIGGIVGIGVNAAAVEDDTLHLVMDSILSTMLNVVGSVKAIHKYTRDMEYYATRDPLTDLYNRRVFWELLDYEVARATRHDHHFALLVVDLDNFKLINDSHGHSVGDRYLQAFAHAIKEVLRPGDIFARYGGDEFVMMLPEVTMPTAAAVAQRVLDTAYELTLDAPDGSKICGSISIGLALYPLHANNAKDLFLFADNMMYKAKGAGKHQIGLPSDEEVAEVFRDMTQTTMLVVNAINEGRIDPFFQPIMDLQGEQVVAFEVLSRLSLDGEHIPAARFIEFAEKAGVIHRLDTMVMEKALRVVAAAKFSGLIFLNLSPRALALADYLQTLKRTVAACGIEPGQIVFEITERDTVKNIVVLEKLVGELKLAGFKLAIDDFGSGFSSFQYLRRFPVDYLKIEGDFVLKILDNHRDRSFVETIHKLAFDLGIKVIAEHVENAEILAALNGMGIEMAQGYYIGRPEKELGANMRWPMV